jgi:hypothetical protein
MTPTPPRPRRPTPALGRSRRLALSLVLFGLAMVFSLAVVEIGLRLLGYHGDTAFRIENTIVVDDPLLNWRHRPSSNFYFNDVVYAINERGFRDYIYPFNKPAGTFRIFLASDSVGFGTNVPMEQSYPKRLEQRLNEQHLPYRVEVINYSMPGLSIKQKVHLVQQYSPQYHPDLIVVDYVLNDVEFESRKTPAWEMQCHVPFTGVRMPCVVAGLMKRSATVVFLRQAAEGLLHRVNWEQRNEYYQQVQTDYYHRLYAAPDRIAYLHDIFGQMSTYQREHNVPIVLAIFPLIYDYGHYKWDDLNTMIVALCEENRLRCVPLLDTYRQFDYNELRVQRGDFTHPSAKGNELAAASIGAFLTKSRLLPAAN